MQDHKHGCRLQYVDLSSQYCGRTVSHGRAWHRIMPPNQNIMQQSQALPSMYMVPDQAAKQSSEGSPYRYSCRASKLGSERLFHNT